MLKAENIHKSYGKLEVLKGVDLTVSAGEVVSLVGSSGAGKSTLLQILGTLDRPDQGTIIFEGGAISNLKDKRQAEFRNKHLGFVFQFHHLLPEFNALENVCIPAFIAGTPKSEAEKRARELLGFLQLGERLDHKPAELSGGEQQRVAMARALINKPKLILADEPTGNLDTGNSDKLYALIRDLVDHYGTAFLVATHNEKYAAAAHRMLHIQDGRIVKEVHR